MEQSGDIAGVLGGLRSSRVCLEGSLSAVRPEEFCGPAEAQPSVPLRPLRLKTSLGPGGRRERREGGCLMKVSKGNVGAGGFCLCVLFGFAFAARELDRSLLNCH